jgi:hypothetical protein
MRSDAPPIECRADGAQGSNMNFCNVLTIGAVGPEGFVGAAGPEGFGCKIVE